MRLFCYGTLMIPEVMRRLSGGHLAGIAASLEGYGRYTVKGQVFPGIRRENGAVTQGLVYTGIGDRLLRRLDHYEGNIYERRRVCVSDPEGRSLQAWAYVIPAASRGVLSGEPWERRIFERQHLETYLQVALPTE